MAITGLGHVGIFVRDLEKMVAFYRDFLGLQVTKQNWRAGVVFLSADPEAADHQIALVRGRPQGEEPRLIQQISFGCAALDDVRQFHRRLVAGGYRIQRVVNHWVPVSIPIDLEQGDVAVLAEVENLWQRVRDIGVGERMPDEPATLQF